MTDGMQGLDEILSDMAFPCAGGITENGEKEYLPAKQAILQWVNDEVIGEVRSYKKYETCPRCMNNQYACVCHDAEEALLNELRAKINRETDK